LFNTDDHNYDMYEGFYIGVYTRDNCQVEHSNSLNNKKLFLPIVRSILKILCNAHV